MKAYAAAIVIMETDVDDVYELERVNPVNWLEIKRFALATVDDKDHLNLGWLLKSLRLTAEYLTVSDVLNTKVPDGSDS